MRVAAAGLLLAAVFLAAGCGGPRQAAPTTHTSTAPAVKACVLSARQRQRVAAAVHEIAVMHRLEQPLKTWHMTGPTKLELAVNRFLLDVGPLPVDTKEHLLNLGKSAVGLCGDCFNALESEEPAPQTRTGRSPCAG